MKVKVRLKSKSATPAVVDVEPAAVLIAQCFNARDAAHKLHLQTQSYAQHMALGAFYEGITSLVDSYAESWQGRYGVIAAYPTIPESAADPLALIINLREFIDNTRVNCGTTSELQNDIDAIVTLCNSTIYKLQNLK